jgi:hypothetical protein
MLELLSSSTSENEVVRPTIIITGATGKSCAITRVKVST